MPRLAVPNRAMPDPATFLSYVNLKYLPFKICRAKPHLAKQSPATPNLASLESIYVNLFASN